MSEPLRPRHHRPMLPGAAPLRGDHRRRATRRPVAEAADRCATLLVRGAHDTEDEDVVARVVHLADTEGLDTLADLWSGSPADSLAGCLWRLYLLRTWVYADPAARRPRVRRRPPAHPGARGGRRCGRPARPRRGAPPGRPGAARASSGATSPTRSTARRRSPGWWPPVGPHLGAEPAGHAVRRGPLGGPAGHPGRAARARRRARDRGPARLSGGSPCVARTPACTLGRAPGRGSPGSQNKPLRAATRREALPVRRTTSASVSAAAIRAGQAALASTRAMLARQARPARCARGTSRAGTASRPCRRCPAAPPRPAPTCSVRSCSARVHLVRRRRSGGPPPGPARRPSGSRGAHHGGHLRRASPPATAPAARCRGCRSPGNVSVPKPITGTDSDSSRSSVAGTSRIDFTPAHTTVTGTCGQRVEVGRLVPGLAGAAVHAAQPTGGEDPDAGQVGQVRRRRHRRRPGQPLGSAPAPRSRMLVLTTSSSSATRTSRSSSRPDPDRAVDDGDRGGHRAGAAYRVLDLAGGGSRWSRWAARG